MGYKRAKAEPLNCPFKPSQHCGRCDCRKRCFFNFLSGDSLNRFRLERRMRRWRARQVVFHEDEPPQGIFILCAGEAKISKSDRLGRELTLQHLSHGDLFGEVSFLAGDPYCGSAVTLQESVVCFLPRALVEHLRAAEPEFSRKLLSRVSRSLCRTMERAVGFAFQSAEGRLASFVLRLALPGEAGAPPCRLSPQHTRRQIAENLGLSPETVIRALSSFQTRGLVRLVGKTIEILDRTGLESLADRR